MIFIKLLATAVGIVSAIALVVVGLVEAPWQLLLVGLLAALYGLQRQIWVSESITEIGSAVLPTDVEAQSKSALFQAKQAEAGTTDDSPAALAPEGEECIYRGIRYRASQPESPPAPAEKVEGIYRGQPWER